MNTELHDFYKANGREALAERVSNLETELLFAELDDTIQFDILKASCEKWDVELHGQKAVYRAIISELKKRCT